MLELPLTESAQRVLASLPSKDNWPDDPARLLLRAMLADEGHGTELLRDAGISDPDLVAVETTVIPVSEAIAWRLALLRAADRFAAQLAPAQATGSEHLLLAILQSDAPLREALDQHGLRMSVVIEQLTPPPPELIHEAGPLLQVGAAGPGNVDQGSLHRILDASANRCREGLRVVEDAARFQLNDAFLARELKEIRHALTATLIHLGQQQWITSRDTQHDVGARTDLASERSRGSLLDVLRAAMKRVEESLRSLEEYSKLIDGELAARVTGCRYRFYTIEKALETSLRSRQRLADCRLYLLVTAANCRYDAERTIRDVITAGVDIVQLREKEMPVRQFVAYAEQVRRWTREAGTLLIINDRVDVAVACGADGVHLGQDDLDVATARKILGGGGLIGVSTHRLEQARTAVFAGADYLGAGPVFPSTTKDFTDFPGTEYVNSVCREVSLPIYAIGGISEQNLAQVTAAGCCRVAVSSAICQAPHPPRAATKLAEILRAAAQTEQLKVSESAAAST